jgi:hypothetical protein
MQGQILTIRTDGSRKVTPLGAPPTLELLQKEVGGSIETVPNFDTFEGKPAVAFCNEEGKIDGLPLNGPATKIWAEALDLKVGNVPWSDVLVGDVIIITGDDELLEAL